jgi:hypothetical protein
LESFTQRRAPPRLLCECAMRGFPERTLPMTQWGWAVVSHRYIAERTHPYRRTQSRQSACPTSAPERSPHRAHPQLADDDRNGHNRAATSSFIASADVGLGGSSPTGRADRQRTPTNPGSNAGSLGSSSSQNRRTSTPRQVRSAGMGQRMQRSMVTGTSSD